MTSNVFSKGWSDIFFPKITHLMSLIYSFCFQMWFWLESCTHKFGVWLLCFFSQIKQHLKFCASRNIVRTLEFWQTLCIHQIWFANDLDHLIPEKKVRQYLKILSLLMNFWVLALSITIGTDNHLAESVVQHYSMRFRCEICCLDFTVKQL